MLLFNRFGYTLIIAHSVIHCKGFSKNKSIKGSHKNGALFIVPLATTDSQQDHQRKKLKTWIAKVKCYGCSMWEQGKRNLYHLFKYSDTHLYEFALSLTLLVLNPYHLGALKVTHRLDLGSIRLLIAGTIMVGLCQFYGVVVGKLETRHKMARVYWVYTVFTLLTLGRCALEQPDLLISFGMQFVSSFFLLWRLGTERYHRLHRTQGDKHNV